MYAARYDIDFRPLTRADFSILARWLAQPHVARWWNHEYTMEAVERDFGPSVDGTDPTGMYLVLLDDRPIGLIQCSRFADFPEYREEIGEIADVPDGAATIDYLIGEADLTGRGLGTAMIAAFVERLWKTDPSVTSLLVAVNSANVASWRALLGAGFVRVDRGDLEPDNPIDDSLHEILRLDRPRQR
ncbi:MAG TPA: GNAT family N-acetyltransferase [Acidimicrobiia bacterium]|jgi:aminoglycoside 6'-N-acetyltransferase